MRHSQIHVGFEIPLPISQWLSKLIELYVQGSQTFIKVKITHSISHPAYKNDHKFPLS